MILLTRFHGGEHFAVNPDLIERIEATPDTVITLTNGAKHVVQESLDEIAEKVQIFKATTLAIATRMVNDPGDGSSAPLRIIRGGEEDPSNHPDSSGS